MSSFFMRLIGKGLMEYQKNVLVKGSVDEVASIIKGCYGGAFGLVNRLVSEVDDYNGRTLKYAQDGNAETYVLNKSLAKPEYSLVKIKVYFKPTFLMDAEWYFNERIVKEIAKKTEVLLEVKEEAAPVVKEEIVVEDYSKLNLNELVAKFEEKLELFKAEVNNNNLQALTALKININSKIKGEADLEKQSKMVSAFANVNQYVDTLNTQMSTVGPNIIKQFLSTYVTQMETSLLQLKALLQ